MLNDHLLQLKAPASILYIVVVATVGTSKMPSTLLLSFTRCHLLCCCLSQDAIYFAVVFHKMPSTLLLYFTRCHLLCCCISQDAIYFAVVFHKMPSTLLLYFTGTTSKRHFVCKLTLRSSNAHRTLVRTFTDNNNRNQKYLYRTV